MADARYIIEHLYFNYDLSNELNGFHDMQYQHFWHLMHHTNGNLYYGKVDEIHGIANMLNMFPDYSLVTSCSADFDMNTIILSQFESEFNNIERLQAENVRTGGVAYLNYENTYVYYLIVKDDFFTLPTYYTVWLTLLALKNHVILNNVKKIACNQIASAPDDILEWAVIKQMLEYIFMDVDIDIKAFDMFMPLNNNYE